MFAFADKNNIFEGYEYDAQCLVQQYFSYNVAVSFVGRGNRRKPPLTETSMLTSGTTETFFYSCERSGLLWSLS
jgi:hypothetical protein